MKEREAVQRKLLTTPVAALAETSVPSFATGLEAGTGPRQEGQRQRIAQLRAQTPELLETPAIAPEPIQLKHADGGGTIQLHQHATSMRKRRRFKRSLKTAINRILAAGNDSGPANIQQINIHDAVQHAGQHHGFRNVTVQQLIGDIQDTIDNQTQLNLAESDNP
jgi:hypothetical protein